MTGRSWVRMPRSRPKNWQSMAPGASPIVFLGFSRDYGNCVWQVTVYCLGSSIQSFHPFFGEVFLSPFEDAWLIFSRVSSKIFTGVALAQPRRWSPFCQRTWGVTMSSCLYNIMRRCDVRCQTWYECRWGILRLCGFEVERLFWMAVG